MQKSRFIVCGLFFFTSTFAFSQPVIVVTPNKESGGGIVDRYNTRDPNYHDYPYETFICKTDKLSVDEAYDKFISQAKFLAPVYDYDQQVYDKCKLLLKIDMPGLVLPGYHPIEVHINKLEHKVINYTLPDHILHPGKVERRIIERNDSVFIATRGIGAISIKKFTNYYIPASLPYYECLKEYLIANGLTNTELFGFVKPLEKLATWFSERSCVIDHVWYPVDRKFVEFVKGLPDKSDDSSPDLTADFIWKTAYPSISDIQYGMAILDGGKEKIEIANRYTYTIRDLEKTVVLFYKYSYYNGEKSNCHVCTPEAALARYVKKNGLWRLEQFADKDLVGFSMAWGKPATVAYIERNGKKYLRASGSDMHFGDVQKWTNYYNLENFKDEKLK